MVNKKFAAKVRQRLESIGMSQSELGRVVGVSQQNINDLLRRDTPPIAVKLAAIARTLGVSVDYLVDDSRPVGDDARGLSPIEGRILYAASVVGMEEAERRIMAAAPADATPAATSERYWGGEDREGADEASSPGDAAPRRKQSS